MSKHTPGPWEVFHEPSLNRFRVSSGFAGAKTITSVSYWEKTTPWDREKAEANARLIAAAPALLAACLAAMEGNGDWMLQVTLAVNEAIKPTILPDEPS